ncbi:MAG: hypothetical protein ACRDKJ_08800, partial [Actinomycetota bacterium]
GSGAGFGAMIVYLIALQRGLSSFRLVNQRITSTTRFYPQIKRYLSFVETSEALLREGAKPGRPATLSLEVARPALEGSALRRDLDPPSRLGLLSPIPVDRYSLGLLVDSLFGGADNDAARYVLTSSAFATPDYELLARQPFRTSVGLPEDWDADRLLAELGALGLQGADVQAIPALDSPCDDDAWRRVGEGLRFTLAALSASRSSAEWVFLDERGLGALNSKQRSALLDRLGRRVVVVVYHHRRSDPGAYGEDVVAVVDGEDLVGLGPVDWFRQNRGAAEEALLEGPLGDVRRVGFIPDDEEDDEAEDG